MERNKKQILQEQDFQTLDEVEDTLATALAAYHNNKEAVQNLSKGFHYFNKIDGG